MTETGSLCVSVIPEPFESGNPGGDELGGRHRYWPGRHCLTLGNFG